MKKRTQNIQGVSKRSSTLISQTKAHIIFWALGATGNLVAKDGVFMSLFNQGGIFRGIGYYQESKLKLFAIILFTRH